MRFGVPRFGPKPPSKVAPDVSRDRKPLASDTFRGLPAAQTGEPRWGSPIIEVNPHPIPMEDHTEPRWGEPIVEVNPFAVAAAIPEPEPLTSTLDLDPDPDAGAMTELPTYDFATERLAEQVAWAAANAEVGRAEVEILDLVLEAEESMIDEVSADELSAPEIEDEPAPDLFDECVVELVPEQYLLAELEEINEIVLEPELLAVEPKPPVLEAAVGIETAVDESLQHPAAEWVEPGLLAELDPDPDPVPEPEPAVAPAPSLEDTTVIVSVSPALTPADSHPLPAGAQIGTEEADSEDPALSPAASLQGIALEEELRQVSDGLWAFKRFLEQYRDQLGREKDTRIGEIGSGLRALEDRVSALHRDWQVEMEVEDKLAILEQSGDGLAATVQMLIGQRASQMRTLTMTEELKTVIQRYSDLLEKVALLEGNLKRYMKVVDGTAKTRLRQAQRQDFIGSSAIIRSQEMERQRIAREIHDGPAQAIANVILRLDLVERMMREKPAMVPTEFAKMKEIAQGALNEIRGFIFDLRPMTLQDLGLTATLKKIVQSQQTLSECRIELIVEGAERALNPEAELAIFRIAQEALTNVKKHALATNAYVHLKYLPNEVVLIVEDDGGGFEPHKSTNGEYTHYGLIGMQERADDIDGDLQVISQKGRGTKVIFSLQSGE